ncbi:MAG: tetratricopeptide repeat protein [Deltaproteobacteria bacterium]|nr:tetratricopeptide repeat protein [Deltaproteobacteria bacterium]
MADLKKNAGTVSVDQALKKIDIDEMQRMIDKGEVELPTSTPPTIEDTYTAANIEKFILGEITWAQLQGITMEQAYAIAEFGYGLYKEGKFHDAQKVFEGLVICNPYDSYFHNMLGAVYQQLDMKDEALESYSNAVELDSDNLHAFVNRGELLLQNGDFDKALDDLRHAIGLDPDGKEAAGLRARALATATANAMEAIQKVMAGAAKGTSAAKPATTAKAVTPKPMGKTASKSGAKPKPMGKTDSKAAKAKKSR